MRHSKEDLEKAYAKGEDLLMEGDWPAAADEFGKLHGVNPFLCSLGLGKVALQKGDFKAARDHFLRASSLQPGSVQALCYLGASYLELGDLEVALEKVEAAARKGVDLAEIHHYRGRIMAAMGQNRQAEEDLALAVEIHPENPEFHYHLGDLLAAVGNLPGAIEHLQQAIRLRSDYFQAYPALAEYMVRAGQGEEALALLNRAGEEVHSPDVFRALFLAAIAAGDDDSAQKALRWLDDNLEGGRDKSLEIATLLHRMGKLEAAERSLDLASKWAPEDWRVWYAMGTVQADGGKVDEAAGSFERAAIVDPVQWKPYHALGMLAAKRGEDGQAVAHFKDSLNAKPDELITMVSLAEALHRIGKNHEALELARKMMQDQDELNSSLRRRAEQLFQSLTGEKPGNR